MPASAASANRAAPTTQLLARPPGPAPLIKPAQNTQDSVRPACQPAASLQVTQLLARYLAGFKIAPEFSEGEVEHYLLPVEDVICTYVVESHGERSLSGRSLGTCVAEPPSQRSLSGVCSSRHACGQPSSDCSCPTLCPGSTRSDAVRDRHPGACVPW